MYPPSPLVRAVKTVRKVLGKDALRIAESVTKILARRGYRTQLSAAAKKDIRRHYGSDNKRLRQLLQEVAAKQAPAKDT
jgi:hypothetical protein